MPACNRSASAELRYPDFDELPTVAEQDNIPSRAGKRKTKNAAARQLPSVDHADDSTDSAAMGQSQTPVPSSNAHSSTLGQLPQTVSQNRNNSPHNALSDANPSQKDSDEHTPPVDLWARSAAHGKFPPVEPIPGLNTGSLTPYEPGFSSRGAFNARSPPISPPVRKARPVSHGSGIPPLPARVCTSPYGYGMTAYGSPPALPHMPQNHFYGVQDIDLGVRPPRTPLPEPAPLKFAHLPISGHDAREAILLAVDGELHVVVYNGEKVEHLGSLAGVPGTILDATLLTWATGEDQFADYRPLVALTIHGLEDSRPGSPSYEDQNFHDAQNAISETKVVVFSISKSCQIVELLRVPAAMAAFPGIPATAGYPADLKVQASGNFIVVASATSGELFIFTIRAGKGSAAFECLGKYWTTIQPQLQRRDSSSHGRASDADVSPADLGRGSDSESPPILSLSGRWLAFCPASTSSRRSIGAELGFSVVHNKNSNVSAGIAPSRPLANCEVDSPDVDTFFGKVAKGFAQEAVKGAKWISEKGMQTWQNYWKKDTGSPGLHPAPSSSPPVYSPYLGLAQFPPTHAVDQQGLPRDPDLVSVLDLKMLHDNRGRKVPELSTMTTFQPPGGCSFLSFMPVGLGLLTANRKGDVQYIWDLMQLKYMRNSLTPSSTDGGRVRQVARYERMSPSTIVDLAWDGPSGYRFALLTKNRTIHIFDLPKTAFQWPPPPIKKHRPTSAPVDPPQLRAEHDPAPSGGFLASAMSIAGRTQPMLASLRGRAPSVSGGIAGIAPSGIGFTSTTSLRSGGRAVAAGLSKSLGAASETVTSIRHANQSRLHLKIPARIGMLCWLRRDGKSVLSILDESSVKNYYIRMTKPRENRQMDTVSVFDARKAVATKLLKAGELLANTPSKGCQADTRGDCDETPVLLGFWKSKPTRDVGSRTPHPLASAEIETNALYQPFHSDRRVTISLIPENSTISTTHVAAAQVAKPAPTNSRQRRANELLEERWLFGGPIAVHTQSLAKPKQHVEVEGSAIFRETTIIPTNAALAEPPVDTFDEDITQVVSSTKKKKGKKNRAQAPLVEEEPNVKEHLAHDVPFQPDEDLIVAGEGF